MRANSTRTASGRGSIDGVLDTRPSSEVGARTWNYVTLGFGHGEEWWRQFCAALRMAGYDDVLSIEHEDSLIDPLEGVRKSVELLRNVTYRGA